MFKFNFNIIETTAEAKVDNICDGSNNSVEWCEANEVILDNAIFEDYDVYKLNSTKLKINNVTLAYMIPTHILQCIDDSSNIKKAYEKHTDLIPGIYEGGVKLWECTDDLLLYLQSTFSSEIWKNKNVLDLGCGCGLLGIFTFIFGATVHFQDYNEDVLRKVTIPNVLLNYPTEEIDLKELSNRTKFFSGDWSKYTEFTKEGPQFDFILSSETIYNAQNHKKLLQVFAKKVKPNGIVLVAAKSHYFGVGGNLKQFEDLIMKDGLFDIKSVWVSNTGVSREIIELRKRIEN